MTLSLDQKAVRVAAREAVAAEVQAGRLKREPCERCGEVKTQAHHDDYSKPLQVRWLCQEHHTDVHREIGAPMGRQLRADSPGRPRAFRVTDAEWAQWTRATEAEGCSTMSAWAVKTLNARAERMAPGKRSKR